MKKIEIFNASSEHKWQLSQFVNEFISTHNVVDIQFQYSGNDYHGKSYAVMIVYEED